MENSLGRLLKSLCFCFDPIGSEADYYGAVTPYMASVSRIDAVLKLHNPALHRWLQQGDLAPFPASHVA